MAETINSYFSHVSYINLKRRPDRDFHCKHKLQVEGIIAERFEAIDGENIHPDEVALSGLLKGELGCLKSHCEIIKLAKEKEYNRILLIEDDIVWAPNFNDMFSQYIKQVDDTFNLLYFGGNHSEASPDGKGAFLKTANTLCVKNTLTTTAWATQYHMYDRLINLFSQGKKQVDKYLCDVQRFDGHSYCFHPSIVWQEKGYSDVQSSYTDYDILLKYTGEPRRKSKL